MLPREPVSNIEVFGLDSAVRASKYPMQTDVSKCVPEITNRTVSLAQAKSGSGHDTWLKGVLVKFDLCATVKLWIQAERYHWFDIVSSQSQMHCLPKFDLNNSYCRYVDPRAIELMSELLSEYAANPTEENELKLLYTNPQGFCLTAGISTNYLQLKTIYHQRRFHKLPEWKELCRIIESLPYSYFITGEEADSD